MIFKNILKFIFPSRCIICDTVLPYGNKLENEYLCNDCRDGLEFIKNPICKKCGAMISQADGDLCPRCKENMPKYFEYGFGLCRYNELIRLSIHKIKYQGRKEYLYFYGKMIAMAFKDKFKKISPDLFIPVPIHKKRLRERNYNQSGVLAYVISEELKKYSIDIPVDENIIFRTKNTTVLNRLDSKDRGVELDDAFETNDVVGIEKVVVVDDIYTTGATIDRVAKNLKECGVKEVYFTTIAIVDNL